MGVNSLILVKRQTRFRGRLVVHGLMKPVSGKAEGGQGTGKRKPVCGWWEHGLRQLSAKQSGIT